jgi:CzcA family heavy metal efflux pump
MLNALIRFSLRQRMLVLAAAVVVMIMGLWTVQRMPVDVLPDLTKPTVTILTEAPNYSPQEVETLVTIPLENALMGVTGVSRLRTINDVGLSLTFVEFDWGTDIYRARQFVQERLGSATESLPGGIIPYMTPAASLMGNILLVGLVDPSDKMTPSELRMLADWTVARRIQSIPGVAEVAVMGGGVAQIQVQPHPDRMLALGVSFDEVHKAAAAATSNTSGGFLTQQAMEMMVRNLAMTTDLEAIAETLVRHGDDSPIRLRDVATVTWGVEPMRGDAGLGSQLLVEPNASAKSHRGVILSITKSPGFDTLALTKKVETELHGLQATLPGNVRLLPLYRQGDFIELSMDNLEEALRDGAIMVALILFLSLLNFRITLITLTAIPLSLGITVLVFNWLGLSVNSMTIGGLAVAIGMVVDDAIVNVENVYRRLRENATLGNPRPKLEVIAQASAEVRSSILYATLLIILVFIPLMALTGLEGRLFTPIAIATIVSMSASFFVSITLIPVLGSLFLNPRSGQAHPDPLPVRWLKFLFRTTALRLSMTQPLTVIAGTLVLIVLACVALTRMEGNFLPAFREPTVLIATTLTPGTSLQQTTEAADVATELLLQIPEIETVSYRAGRAERDDHVVPVSTVEFDVEFVDIMQRPRSEVLADIRETMRSIPGTFSVLSTPLADRIGHMLSGVSAQVAIKIFGPDLDELRRLGTQVVAIAHDIPGLEQARLEQQAPISQLRIEIDRQRAMVYGLTPAELNQQLSTLIGGESVAKVYEGERIFDLVVRLPEAWRDSPQRLANLTITTLSGQAIPLHYVADLRHATGPNTILRENTQRRFVVSINPSGSNLNALVEELQRRVAEEIQLPTGYNISFEGEYQAQQQARKTIAAASIVVALIIALLLHMYFRSFTFVLLVFSIVPISLTGGVLYTAITLNNISIATLVGFVAVSGISARNNIMLLSHYLHLMRKEGEGFTREMVERGTEERLMPILMTATSAALALVPLLLAVDAPGKEILNPVAIVIVGGLLSSTVMGLVVTPALFYAFAGKAARKSVIIQSPASE